MKKFHAALAALTLCISGCESDLTSGMMPAAVIIRPPAYDNYGRGCNGCNSGYDSGSNSRSYAGGNSGSGSSSSSGSNSNSSSGSSSSSNASSGGSASQPAHDYPLDKPSVEAGAKAVMDGTSANSFTLATNGDPEAFILDPKENGAPPYGIPSPGQPMGGCYKDSADTCWKTRDVGNAEIKSTYQDGKWMFNNVNNGDPYTVFVFIGGHKYWSWRQRTSTIGRAWQLDDDDLYILR